MNATTTHTGEVIEVGIYIADMGHRPVCSCGWVGTRYPLGHLDRARAALNGHKRTHTA